MSVMLHDNEKFLRVYESLRFKNKDIAHIWNYPSGWRDPNGLDEYLRIFTNDLRRANTITWNRQYEDDQQPIEALTFMPVSSYQNDYELLKSLESISYNLIDNGGKDTNLCDCYHRLEKLIFWLMAKIVSELPEYKTADTW